MNEAVATVAFVIVVLTWAVIVGRVIGRALR